MLILPISRSWILSRTAERIYLYCAILSMALSGTWIGTRAAQIFAGKPSLSPETATALLSILFAEVVGAALLQVAMLYFWFGFDDSSWLRRAFWFLLLCFVLPFFWALYYFFVYRRQVRDRLEKSTPALCDS